MMMNEKPRVSPVMRTLQWVGFLSVLVFLIDYTFEVMELNRLYESRRFLLILLQLMLSLWALVELSLVSAHQSGMPLSGLKVALVIQGLAGGSRLWVGQNLNAQGGPEPEMLAHFQLGWATLYVPVYLIGFLAIFKLLIDAFSHEERQRAKLLRAEIVTRLQAEEALRDAQQEILQGEIERVQAEERQRIIHDLHDGFGSQLVSARYRLTKAAASQAEIVELLNDCINDLYLVVDALDMNEGRLEEALRLLRERLKRRLVGTRLQIDWDVRLGKAAQLAPAKIVQVLRILQEAINNALKHARAQHVLIAAHQSPSGHITITICDDGIGLPETLTLGHGLNNMQRRARELGGLIRFERANPGTCITLQFPASDDSPNRPEGAELPETD